MTDTSYRACPGLNVEPGASRYVNISHSRLALQTHSSLVCLSLCLCLAACDSRIANHPPGSNPWLDGNPGQFVRFAANAEAGPVYMLNLLKFAPKTVDGALTGAQSYAKYGELAAPYVARHGGKLIWAGRPTEQLIGDMDYDWDMVLIVEWPNRQKLIDLGEDPDYEAIAHYRGDGLARSMLIAMDQLEAF